MHGTNPPPASVAAPVKEAEDLKAVSLIFVRTQQQSTNAPQVKPAVEDNAVMDLLPVGTHLVARLEAPVSTALAAPVVAVIEYNYEQGGQIILPAGTEVIGKLRSATPQGDVSLEFDELEFSDGTTQKIAASAMGLDYKPLKGHVTGRNRGLRFLVQSLTGVGEVAAYMVGGSPGSTSVFSEDALLREQLAANMAMAGQQQFNQLAMTQHIVVTVPGNTRFYLVLEQGTTPKSAPASLRPVSNPSSLPSEQELMELMELKRELAAVSQNAGSATAQPAAATQP
ncbi:MAG TPA: TrbI/VirB10 family protein [Terriglobia bacterium]|nr:TrbI/VirB10 family protein [Terriglobia bacterium]